MLAIKSFDWLADERLTAIQESFGSWVFTGVKTCENVCREPFMMAGMCLDSFQDEQTAQMQHVLSFFNYSFTSAVT